MGVVTAELSFWGSVGLEFFKAFFAAVFTGLIAAGIILLARRVLSGQKEKHQLRIDLVRRTSSNVRGFYFTLQAYRRAAGGFSTIPPVPPAELDEKVEAVREAYRVWATEAGALEAELEAYFGPFSDPVVEWHQMRDLLTVAYFSLAHPDPVPPLQPLPRRFVASEGLRRANALSPEKRHTGLTLEELLDLPRVLRKFSEVSQGFGQELLHTDWSVGWWNWGEA